MYSDLATTDSIWRRARHRRANSAEGFGANVRDSHPCKKRKGGAALPSNCPTQAKVGLEWATRPLLLEGIAGGDRSVLEAALEPLHALSRAAVSESLGIDRASGHALDAIVPNRRGCPQP